MQALRVENSALFKKRKVCYHKLNYRNSAKASKKGACL